MRSRRACWPRRQQGNHPHRHDGLRQMQAARNQRVPERVQVEKDGKTVNYYLTQNKVSKDFHANICQNDGEKVTVTGTVKEKGGKEMMSPTKIEAAK